MPRYLPTLAVLLLLPSCGPLIENYCNSKDWHQSGYDSGFSGASSTAFESDRSTCASVGITADREGWMRGHRRGVQEYCTIDNAYEIGKRGDRISTVCTPDQRNRMSAAHRDGLKHYEFTKRIRDLQSQRRDEERRLAATPKTNEDGSVNPEYRRLQRRIDDLRDRIADLRDLQLLLLD